MKKIILALLMLSCSCVFAQKNPNLQTVPVFNSNQIAENKVWVGTFELVWNDLMDNVVKAPIIFADEHNSLADEFNKQDFKKDYLSDNSYYITHGIMTNSLKKTIENDLKNKFNEKSDFLDELNWNGKNFLAYSMLKKDFEFVTEFKKLKKEKFANGTKKVKYFGAKYNSSTNLRENINVLFYNDKNDFAVQINTKQKDKVILYRTNDNLSFEKLYSDLLDKSSKYEGLKSFSSKDELKIPFVEFKTKHIYNDLKNKSIAGTNITIDEALQTINFKMTNKGVKLKSEAGLVMKMSLEPTPNSTRKFYFDNKFILFLIEKEKPYFALRITDDSLLKK